MSSQTSMMKRKNADAATTITTKRAKVVKSAEKPAPLKSALKRPETAVSTTKKPSTRNAPTTKPSQKKTRHGGAAVEEKNKTAESREDDEVKLLPDQTADLLAGFSSSEDEGAASEDENGIAIASIPKAPTTDLIQERITQAISKQDDPENTPGVIYVGRVPHGFYEPQMSAYFSQFGEIINLRLGRSKKTGRSQHHAFVEFASAAVADIVVKTMDKYLLFGHILQVRRVPREQVKDNMFAGSGRRKPAPRNKLEGSKLKRGVMRDVWEQRVEKENLRRAEKAGKLKAMGYEFDMPLVRSVAEVPVKPKFVEAAPVVEDGTGGADLVEDEVSAPSAAIETAVEVLEAAEGNVAKEVTATKKRSGGGKTQTKKVIKKVKK